MDASLWIDTSLFDPLVSRLKDEFTLCSHSESSTVVEGVFVVETQTVLNHEIEIRLKLFKIHVLVVSQFLSHG